MIKRKRNRIRAFRLLFKGTKNAKMKDEFLYKGLHISSSKKLYATV